MAVIVGTSGADSLPGTFGADEISGLAGNDTLDGARQADTLLGGGGNDSLSGGTAGDLLNGGIGADTMEGGPGWDTYIVGTAGDVVIELAGGGTEDRVQSSITYALTSEVEHLTLTGSADIDGTGNSGNNTVTGNSGDNILRGADGDDVLNGGLGADTLTGGAGADTLDGGSGDDRLVGGNGADVYIRDGSETIVEFPGGGIDSVRLTEGLTAPANVENFTYIGTLDDIGFGGNELDNLITGNALNQTMRGGGGNDTISYAYETSSVTVDLQNESATGSGDDFIRGFENALGGAVGDTLIGSTLDNLLDGRGGVDTMEGGDGDDTYLVDDVNDVVVETDNTDDVNDVVVETDNTPPVLASDPGSAPDPAAALEGIIDTVIAVVSYSLENLAFVENIELDGTATTATGNELNNLITGNTLANTLRGLVGNDTLDGGAGSDVLNGGTGADTASYQFGAQGVTVNLSLTTAQATGGSGSDTLTGIERLTGSGFADQLTGNNAANQLKGLGGGDALNGRAGDDTLTGGTGADKFVFSTTLNAGTNVDAIADFSAAEDDMRLDNDIFTALATGNLAAAAFRSAAGAVAAGDANDRIIYNRTTGDIYYDADGTGAAATATLFATLTNTPTITAANFFIIE